MLNLLIKKIKKINTDINDLECSSCERGCYNKDFVTIKCSREEPIIDDTIIAYSEEFEFEDIKQGSTELTFSTTIEDIERNKPIILAIFELLDTFII